MNKALHVFVYLFLALAGAGLYFESQLNAQRELLTRRSRLQEDYFVKLAATIEREDAELDFTRPAVELDRRIRALSPIPNAYFTMRDGRTVKVLSARPAEGRGTPGTVLATSFDGDGCIRVACGDGALDLTRIKPEGKGAMTAADYLRGRKLAVGEVL